VQHYLHCRYRSWQVAPLFFEGRNWYKSCPSESIDSIASCISAERRESWQDEHKKNCENSVCRDEDYRPAAYEMLLESGDEVIYKVDRRVGDMMITVKHMLD